MHRGYLLFVCLFGVLLLVGPSVIAGVIPLPRGHDSARPACAQLPSRKAVADAMASRADLVARIQEVGPGVKVEIATPCAEQPDRALISIKYTTSTEQRGVDAILRQERFGVAIELVSDKLKPYIPLLR